MKKFVLLLILALMPNFAFAQPAKEIFVTLIDNPPILTSRDKILDLVKYSKSAGIKVIYLQVYRANKSWFSSSAADSSLYEATVKKMGEDPVGLLIKEAHAAGVEVHAWLNLLSLSVNKDAPMLKKHGTGILTRNRSDKVKIEDYKIDNQYFLEPGDPRVRNELVRVVEDLLKAHPKLDGVLYDYIRYPDVHPEYGYTPVNMKRFIEAKGEQKIHEKNEIWRNWKRDQVTETLKVLVEKVRALKPKMKVATSGCVSFSRAYDEAFQNWPLWVNSGLTDFVTVMNYPDDLKEYNKLIEDAKKRVNDLSRMKMAVGSYKFIKTPAKFTEQWQSCQSSGANACIVFHYGNFLENPSLKDTLN